MKKGKKLFFSLLMAGAAMTLMTGHALAKERISPICASCHKADDNTIWGTLVPGSQTDSSFKVQAGKDAWEVRYDRFSKLKNLRTVRDLADEKAVMVKFRYEGSTVYAEEMSYKSNYKFKNPDDIITVAEVVELLKKDPKEGNYVIFDSRGYDDYIEGH